MPIPRGFEFRMNVICRSPDNFFLGYLTVSERLIGVIVNERITLNLT